MIIGYSYYKPNYKSLPSRQLPYQRPLTNFRHRARNYNEDQKPKIKFQLTTIAVAAVVAVAARGGVRGGHLAFLRVIRIRIYQGVSFV